MSPHQLEQFLRIWRFPLRKTQARNLLLCISALLQARRCTLTALARMLPGGRLCHRIKRVWRFFDNPRVDPIALAQQVINQVGRLRPQGWLPLLVDDTALGADTSILTVAMPFRGRALPLLAIPYSLRQIRKSLWILRRNVIRQVWQSLGEHAQRAVLVADRAFASTRFFRDLQAAGLRFVIRVPDKVTVQWHIFRHLLQDLDLQPGCRVWLPQVRYGTGRTASLNILAVWEANQARPWLLATNLTDHRTVFRLYAGRMRIEQMFRDWKQHFGLRHSRLTTADRLARLLFILGLAIWALAFLIRRIPQAFRAYVQGRGALSFTSLALYWVDRPPGAKSFRLLSPAGDQSG